MPNDVIAATGAAVQIPEITKYQRPLPQIQMLLDDLQRNEELIREKIKIFFQNGTENISYIANFDRTPYNLQIVADSGKERWEGSKKIEAGKPSISVRLKKSGENGLFTPNELESLKRYSMVIVDRYSLRNSVEKDFSISRVGDSRTGREEAVITFSLDEINITKIICDPPPPHSESHRNKFVLFILEDKNPLFNHVSGNNLF